MGQLAPNVVLDVAGGAVAALAGAILLVMGRRWGARPAWGVWLTAVGLALVARRVGSADVTLTSTSSLLTVVAGLALLRILMQEPEPLRRSDLPATIAAFAVALLAEAGLYATTADNLARMPPTAQLAEAARAVGIVPALAVLVLAPVRFAGASADARRRLAAMSVLLALHLQLVIGSAFGAPRIEFVAFEFAVFLLGAGLWLRAAAVTGAILARNVALAQLAVLLAAMLAGLGAGGDAAAIGSGWVGIARAATALVVLSAAWRGLLSSLSRVRPGAA